MHTGKHPFNYILTTRFKLRLVKRLLGDEHRGRLLDIGCGSGFILNRLEDEFEFSTGIDMSIEALKFGRRFLKSGGVVADAEKLPFKDACFDCVISTDALEHIPDDDAAFREAKRLLRSSGSFLVYVPSRRGLLSNTRSAGIFHMSETNYLRDRRYYTIGSLTKLAGKNGLKIRYVGYHNIFIQEFFTQVLKWAALRSGKKYRDQADIQTFLESSFFPLYRWVLFPVINLLVRIEEIICEKVFRAKIPGHRIVMKCEI